MTDDGRRRYDPNDQAIQVPVDASEPHTKLRPDGNRLQDAIDNLISEVTASNDAQQAIGALENLVSQLRTANQNLVLATVKAQTLRDEAEAVNRRQNEFLAMLAHELRNPLAPISNAATVLERITAAHPLLPKVHNVLSRQVQHMARLLDDLLDASRVSSGKISLQKHAVSLTDIIERAVEVSRPLIDKRSQQLTISAPCDALIIDGDLVRLAQVFSNLLINASKYTQDEGLIGLTVERHGDILIITVSDNGGGIAPEVQPYIFDLFTQGPRSLARTEGGLGVGLTVAKSIVEMHGGDITVKSDGLGRGSSFRVTLPAHAIAPSDATQSTRQAAQPGRYQILLVEDNLDASDTLKMLLELEGHVVDTAPDGLRGLAMATANPYDFLICDIGLPGIDGFELIAQLQQRRDRPTPRMIALSGYGQPEDRAKALHAGFDEYLVKPVDGQQLLRAISLLAAPLSASAAT
ncbi:hybrid sensor histidine kinase/response regulator [Noviherbaspirillum sp.]|uniref:hybrid sensor histidine kinase/response regulator n=1 Tax=Noviherbaspirillum sp. TaxID=1926288 RepID=UPI002FE20390